MTETDTGNPDGKHYVYKGEYDVYPKGKMSSSNYKLMIVRNIFKIKSYMNRAGLENYKNALRIVYKQFDFNLFTGISFTICSFKFKNLIGEGSYGRVYEAAHPATGSCALKEFLNVSKMFDVAEVIKERDLLVYLQHERIVKIYGSFYHKRPYIVLEKCKVALTHVKNIEEYDQVRYAIHLLEGLKYMHSKDILHCDLKPANVLINEQNNLVICDFGCAICLPPGTTDWKTNKILGSPGFSDYLVVKHLIYTRSNDLFAAACIIFTMNTTSSLNYHPGVENRKVYASNFEKGRRINYIKDKKADYELEFLDDRIKLSKLFEDILALMIPTRPELKINLSAEDLLECHDMKELKKTFKLFDDDTLNESCHTKVDPYEGQYNYEQVTEKFGEAGTGDAAQDMTFSRFYYILAEKELLDMTTLESFPEEPTILMKQTENAEPDMQADTEKANGNYDKNKEDVLSFFTQKSPSNNQGDVLDTDYPRSDDSENAANETGMEVGNVSTPAESDQDLFKSFTKVSSYAQRKIKRKIVNFEEMPNRCTIINPVRTTDLNNSLVTGCDVENTLFQIFSKLPEVVELKKNLSKPMLQWVPDLNKVMHMWQLASEKLNYHPKPMEELTRIVMDWVKQMELWSLANEGKIKMDEPISSGTRPNFRINTTQERMHTPQMKEESNSTPGNLEPTQPNVIKAPPTKKRNLESTTLANTLANVGLAFDSLNEYGKKQIDKVIAKEKPTTSKNIRRMRSPSGSSEDEPCEIISNKKSKIEIKSSNPKASTSKLGRQKSLSPQAPTSPPPRKTKGKKRDTKVSKPIDKGGSKPKVAQDSQEQNINWLQCKNCSEYVDEKTALAHSKQCAKKPKKK